MNRSRLGWLRVLVLAAPTLAFVSPPAGVAHAGPPRILAQSETVRAKVGGSAKNPKSPIIGRIIGAAVVAGLSLLIAACAYFGLFPWLVRQRRFPLDAFAIATIVSASSFFLLVLGVFQKDLRSSVWAGSPAWMESLPFLFVILLMIVVDLAAWGYHRSQAKKIRAGG